MIGEAADICACRLGDLTQRYGTVAVRGEQLDRRRQKRFAHTCLGHVLPPFCTSVHISCTFVQIESQLLPSASQWSLSARRLSIPACVIASDSDPSLLSGVAQLIDLQEAPATSRGSSGTRRRRSQKRSSSVPTPFESELAWLHDGSRHEDRGRRASQVARLQNDNCVLYRAIYCFLRIASFSRSPSAPVLLSASCCGR